MAPSLLRKSCEIQRKAVGFSKATIGFLLALSLVLLGYGVYYFIETPDLSRYAGFLPLLITGIFLASYLTLDFTERFFRKAEEGDLLGAEKILSRLIGAGWAFLAKKRRLCRLLSDLYFMRGDNANALSAAEKALKIPAGRNESDPDSILLDQALYQMALGSGEFKDILETLEKKALSPQNEAKRLYLRLREGARLPNEEAWKELARGFKPKLRPLPGFFAGFAFALAEAIEEPAKREKIRGQLLRVADEIAVVRYFDEALGNCARAEQNVPKNGI